MQLESLTREEWATLSGWKYLESTIEGYVKLAIGVIRARTDMSTVFGDREDIQSDLQVRLAPIVEKFITRNPDVPPEDRSGRLYGICKSAINTQFVRDYFEKIGMCGTSIEELGTKLGGMCYASAESDSDFFTDGDGRMELHSTMSVEDAILESEEAEADENRLSDMLENVRHNFTPGQYEIIRRRIVDRHRLVDISIERGVSNAALRSSIDKVRRKLEEILVVGPETVIPRRKRGSSKLSAKAPPVAQPQVYAAPAA